MRITDIVTPHGGVLRLQATDADGALRELGTALAPIVDLDAPQVIDLLARRERVATTAVGDEVAVPHARSADVRATAGVIGLSVAGIDFRAPDGRPVRVFVAFMSPIHGGRHLQALAGVAKELLDPSLRDRLVAASDDADVVMRILSANR